MFSFLLNEHLKVITYILFSWLSRTCRARDLAASQQQFKPRKGQSQDDSLREPLLGRDASGLERRRKLYNDI